MAETKKQIIVYSDDSSVRSSIASALGVRVAKDLAEHEYAVRSVARALAAHCTDLEVPERPHVLQLANVLFKKFLFACEEVDGSNGMVNVSEVLVGFAARYAAT